MHMAPAARPRRRDKPESKAKKRKGAGRKTTVRDLPEHVFEQILFRLGPYSPDLVRAAATCRRWFRVVADAGFLARLATTPHAGDYRTVDGCSLFVPSTPLDVDGSQRFSLDFLPDSESWELADSRGSLLLLSKKSTCEGRPSHDDDCSCCFDLIVCDPLNKRYRGIPWCPDVEGTGRIGLFLADGNDGAGRRVSMSNFRIIAVVQESVAYAMTTGSDGVWRMGEDDDEFPDDLDSITALFFAGRANGSLYWGLEEDNGMVLVLDEATAVFSIARLPENVWGLSSGEKTARVIGSKNGMLRVVRLIGKVLKVFACEDDVTFCSAHGVYEFPAEWVLEKQLWLPEATAGLPGRDERLLQQQVIIITANAEYVLLSLSDETWVFTVELDTMPVEREHRRNMYAGKVYPYELPWPPVLSDLSKEQYGVVRRRDCVTK